MVAVCILKQVFHVINSASPNPQYYLKHKNCFPNITKNEMSATC